MRSAVEEYNLAGKKCVLVLPYEGYHTYLMDAPPVSDDEIAEALPWQVKDYLDFPIEQATVDYIQLPKLYKEAQAQLYAVVAKKYYVDKNVAWLKLLGLEIESVTIPELSIRNISSLLPENDDGFILVRPGLTKSQLLVIKDSVIYMMRSVNVNLTSLMTEGYDISEEVKVQLLEELALEIQRSLEYCNTGEEKIANSIVISPQASLQDNDKFSHLARRLSLPLRVLSFNDVMTVDEGIDIQEQCKCVVAIGGSLR